MGQDGDYIGRVVGGCRLDRVLGRGGMGVVYEAEQLGLGRTVAVKVLAPELSRDEDFRERFEREWRMAASLDHPSVVTIHGAGEEDGLLYIVMRRVPGRDLGDAIDAEGRLDPDRSARIVEQIGGALDTAHRRGLVHRDVKPSNILLEPDEAHGERASLTDFGLMKEADGAGGLTRTGFRVGTLAYMAPEQFENRPADARSDIYSLGCVLYECLTGQPPFAASHDAALMHAHLDAPPPRPSAAAPGVPDALDGVVARAMAKDPAERYASAGDLGRAARAAAAGATPELHERSVATGLAATATLADAPPPAAPRAARTRIDPPPTEITPPAAPGPRRPRRGLVIAGAVAVALLAGGGAAAALLAGGGNEAPGTTVTQIETPTGGSTGATAPPVTTSTVAPIAGTGFLSPTGNIGCVWQDDGGATEVRCDLKRHSGPPPEPRPPDCDLEWGDSFSVRADSSVGTIFCHGDTVFGSNLPVLEYGAAMTNGGITCDSAFVGVTCRSDATGGGFFINREEQRLISS